jgi:acetolactate synthase-1/2/3 large subunit
MAMPTGAQIMLETLHDEGVEVCFANPGTTELDLVRALENAPGIKAILSLQENVCTGAADGYGRMAGRAACTLLHLGPGFANGIANLHNARRARTPIVNIIGDHASWHLDSDAPLTSDIDSLARPVSGWVHRVDGSLNVATAAREAVRQSRARGGQGATLIFPADFQAGTANPGAAREAGPAPRTMPESAWDAGIVVSRLRSARRIVFLLGGGGAASALSAPGQIAVARLTACLGATAYAETFPSRAERGGGLPDFDRLPYFPEPARAVLDPADLVVLVGALPPVTYFGYAGHPSRLVDDSRLLTLCAPGEDAVARLTKLAELLDAPRVAPTSAALPDMADGPLTPQRVAAAVARFLPDGAIVSVEGGSCGYPFYAASAAAARHTTLTNTGGAIGQGLPVALGAAIACPGRPVVALLSDGSTQYTVQSLWTIAREGLPILALIAANHEYAILRNELRRGGASLGAKAQTMTSLEGPRIDWVALANAYGIAASRADTVAALCEAMRAALGSRKPALVEMSL